jgi:hypothetical protein
MCFVPQNFEIARLIEAIPKVLLLKSRYRHIILKYFLFDLFSFSSTELYIMYCGFLVSKHVV